MPPISRKIGKDFPQTHTHTHLTETNSKTNINFSNTTPQTDRTNTDATKDVVLFNKFTD